MLWVVGLACVCALCWVAGELRNIAVELRNQNRSDKMADAIEMHRQEMTSLRLIAEKWR